MIPAEIEPTTLKLPPFDQPRIVVITGSAIRHTRFAMRVQAEFPGLVVAWLQVVPPPPASGTRPRRFTRSNAKRALRLLSNPRPIVDAVLKRIRRLRNSRDSQQDAEQELFGAEILALQSKCYVQPTVVANPNAHEAIENIRRLDPYFILTLGGAIYGKELRACARGLAINQHDGWCPEYRGSRTIEWALYHRDLTKVANTVHVLTDGMDSGPILRRATCCLVEDETIESCFARSVALGTELMCEAVGEIIETGIARVFPQPQFGGYTFLERTMTDEMKDAIRRDLPHLIRRDLQLRYAV